MNKKLDEKFGLSKNKYKYDSVPFKYKKEPTTSTSYFSEINPLMIVGTVNAGFGDGTLWNFYESFYKERLLDDNIFFEAIVNPNDNSFPEVCIIDGEYYLIQGRHRVILSQLHNLSSVKVIVLK